MLNKDACFTSYGIILSNLFCDINLETLTVNIHVQLLFTLHVVVKSTCLCMYTVHVFILISERSPKPDSNRLFWKDFTSVGMLHIYQFNLYQLIIPMIGIITSIFTFSIYFEKLSWRPVVSNEL